MIGIIFVLLLLILFVARLKNKKKFILSEYSEWMEAKGYIKVYIDLYSPDEWSSEYPLVKTNNCLKCFIHQGEYYFVVLKKDSFTNISVYPLTPDYDDIKNTKPIALNTGEIQNIVKL